jgi:hypothetical protein
MGDKKPGLDRRQVLKYVMIGGVATAVMMPNKWVKPVVNAVIPPAHAAASAPATTVAPATTGSSSSSGGSSGTVSAGQKVTYSDPTVSVTSYSTSNGVTTVNLSNGVTLQGPTVIVNGVTY